jgi:hypothetical protein
LFGYVQIRKPELKIKDYDTYHSFYCGLCHILLERFGIRGQITLTYDMTFLVLLLGSLYEPEETGGEETCLPHPIEARAWWRSEISAYAADMNVALAYLKCLDDWEDDGNVGALAEAKLLRKPYEQIQTAYPRQCAVIRESMDALHALEKARCEEPDAAADSFGRLMSELLVYREDRWSETLRALGFSLGRFIYVMDACMDLDSDTIRSRYNPFRRYYGLDDNEQRFRDILKMLLGEGLMAFDRLPLVQDSGILKNILCAGLWTQFDKKYSSKKGQADGTGSV